MITENQYLEAKRIVDDYEMDINLFNIDPFESYKYHSICARATLYPNKTIDEVEAIIEEMKNKY